jgi:hypothetical protein
VIGVLAGGAVLAGDVIDDAAAVVVDDATGELGGAT